MLAPEGGGDRLGRRGDSRAAAGQASTNVFGPITADIPDLAITPQQFIASGNAAAVVARYTGTGKATGKKLDLPVMHLWDVRNGKIARFRQFADTAKFLETVPAGTNADAVTAE